MKPEFRPNIILHIEDEERWRRIVRDTLPRYDIITAAYGGQPKYVESTVTSELGSDDLEAEIARITEDMGEGPTLVSVSCAQVARELLARYLPGAIISDTSFPLNGKKVVEWIQQHGFHDYALIGLSGTPFKEIDPLLKEWFAKGNARYFEKATYSTDKSEFVSQIVRNREDNIRNYSRT